MALETTLELIIGEEKIPLNFDFTNHPAVKAGLTVASVVEIIVAPAGEVVVESPTISGGKIVQALFTPGSVEKIYEVCCKVTTSGNAKPKLTGKLRVIAC